MKRLEKLGLVTLALIAYLIPIGFVVFGRPATSDSFYPLGDTIAGIAGPTVGLVAAILVYRSFQQQFRANQILQKELDERRSKDKSDFLIRMVDRIETEAKAIMDSRIHKTSGAEWIQKHFEYYQRTPSVPTISANQPSWSNLSEFAFHLSRLRSVVRTVQEYVEANAIGEEESKMIRHTLGQIYVFYLRLDLDSVLEPDEASRGKFALILGPKESLAYWSIIRDSEAVSGVLRFWYNEYASDVFGTDSLDQKTRD